jgi:hypothetical protein
MVAGASVRFRCQAEHALNAAVAIAYRGESMLKKIGFVAVAMAAGALVTGGIASAGTPGDEHGHRQGPYGGYDSTDQVGLLNLGNTDLLHNVNAALGVCGNDINVLGVQVPLHDVLNGIGVPVLSPGANSAEGESPYNCASTGLADGGTSQGH